MAARTYAFALLIVLCFVCADCFRSSIIRQLERHKRDQSLASVESYPAQLMIFLEKSNKELKVALSANPQADAILVDTQKSVGEFLATDHHNDNGDALRTIALQLLARVRLLIKTARTATEDGKEERKERKETEMYTIPSSDEKELTKIMNELSSMPVEAWCEGIAGVLVVQQVKLAEAKSETPRSCVVRVCGSAQEGLEATERTLETAQRVTDSAVKVSENVRKTADNYDQASRSCASGTFALSVGGTLGAKALIAGASALGCTIMVETESHVHRQTVDVKEFQAEEEIQN